jgi:AcrR family transcriptional regulator
MSNAYVTMIEWEHGGGASVGSISLDALGEPELAEAIRARNADDTEALVKRLIELDGYDVELRREASGPLGVEQLRSLVRTMLASIPAGTAAGPSDAVTDFHGDDVRIDAAVDEILGSTVLAEYSDAEARTAAATVGKATAAPVGAVTVAAITAAHLGGAALLIAGTGGIALIAAVPIGASLLVYHFLKKQ